MKAGADFKKACNISLYSDTSFCRYGNSAYDLEIYKRSEDDYNDMLQAFQIAAQDTQRRYNLMSRNHTVYKVNSFMLEFSEQIDGETGKIASKLRRVNITGCYLLPILFKTNGIIEDYLIQYPQSEMVKSFKTIIANRKRKFTKDGKTDYYWVWDKEGYNAISNYYYVDALITFYRYYEKYEMPFMMTPSEIEEAKNNYLTLSEEKDKNFKVLIQQTEASIRKELEDEQIRPLREELNRFKGWQSSFCDFLVGGIAQSLNKAFSLVPEKWIKDETNTRDKPIERFVSFVNEGGDPNLSSLIAWFVKLQLTTLLSKDALRVRDVDVHTLNQNAFTSKVVDRITDDQKAMDMMGVVLKQLFPSQNEGPKGE